MKKQTLVLSQVFPCPPKDGGKIDIYRRLHTMQDLAIDTHLIAFFNPRFPPSPADLSLPCITIHPIPWLRRKLSKLLHYKPYFVACRENYHGLDQIIQKLQKQNSTFNWLLTESTHVLPAALYIKKQLQIPHLILRMHNNEPAFFRGLAKSSQLFSPIKLFFYSEWLKYKFYENRLLTRLEKEKCHMHIAHISNDEYAQYRRRYPGISQSFLPAAIHLKQMHPYQMTNSKQILFIGGLAAPNNIQGLKWYLHKVHPLIVKTFPNYSLLIAGNTQGANKKKLLQLFSRFSQVLFIDSPNNLELLYKESCGFINPMQFGAGVKLKTIDAILNGMPVVSTSIGNEGTGLQPGKQLLIADTPAAFAKKILLLLTQEPIRKQLVSSAQEFLTSHYDHAKALQTCLRL